MIKIKNGKVITDKIIDANVYIKDGKIFAVTTEELPFDEEIDAGGLYVSPGFVDTHCHGGGNHDFMDATAEGAKAALKAHMKHGTTTILPTTVADGVEETIAAIDSVLEAIKSDDDLPHVPGMHLEGPYFSVAQAGAQDPKNIVPPVKEDYTRIVETYGSFIKKYAFAPELEGSEEFCRYITSKGVIASAGHTDCTYDDMQRIEKCGLTMVTHLYSGMSTIVRKGGFRVLGAVESTYLMDNIYAEVIADGLHLPPDLLKFIYKFKGPDKMCLITDSMRGADMPEGKSKIGSLKKGLDCIIEDGIAKMPDRSCFAGSVATTDRLVRVFYKKVGVPLEDAVKMASTTPAIAHGFEGIGAIKEGYDADLIFFDDDINIKKIIIKRNNDIKIY